MKVNNVLGIYFRLDIVYGLVPFTPFKFLFFLLYRVSHKMVLYDYCFVK